MCVNLLVYSFIVCRIWIASFLAAWLEQRELMHLSSVSETDCVVNWMVFCQQRLVFVGIWYALVSIVLFGPLDMCTC